MLLLDPWTVLPRFSMVRDVSVHVHEGDYSLCGSVGPRESLQWPVTLLVQSSRRIGHWHDSFIHLAALGIIGDCACVEDDLWAQVLSRNPPLETLSVSMDGTEAVVGPHGCTSRGWLNRSISSPQIGRSDWTILRGNARRDPSVPPGPCYERLPVGYHQSGHMGRTPGVCAHGLEIRAPVRRIGGKDQHIGPSLTTTALHQSALTLMCRPQATRSGERKRLIMLLRQRARDT
ncbi:hypothetical protein BD310DRAFT_916687 [Dichomitus squalens]|uniref:Uncharacterized protein n=1 Tax=Dichomitus squalens TaxID=114155 RepID=A0A4Q9Q7Z4_9APHY|nr:hypothetical protein BD310DRAFT_916687 [Dichomitus squalens]